MSKSFAQIVDGKVLRVIVADNISWCTSRLGGQWVETFKNSPEKNFAGIGYEYHPEFDNFSGLKPFNSWILNDKCQYVAPIKEPVVPAKEGMMYSWDETTLNYKEVPSLISKISEVK